MADHDALAEATRTLYEQASKVARQAPSSMTPTSSSASTLYTSLWFNFLLFAVFIGAFLFLRPIYKRIYAPRSFASTLKPNERAPVLPQGYFSWFTSFMATPDTVVLNTQSLDSFLFLRLLKIAIVICLVGMAITWPILFPVTATGSGTGKELDYLTLGHAAGGNNPSSYYRWFAHALVAWIFYGFVLYMITRESIFFINLRQAYLLSPLYANRLSARTVLFTSVPEAYRNEKVLKEMLGPEVVRVWVPRDTKELEKEVAERDKIALKLEGAETKLIKTANANRLKAIKQAQKKGNGEPDFPQIDDSGNIASRYVPAKKRPTHKLGPLGLWGQKVDSIDWCRSELEKRIPAVKKHQEKHETGQTPSQSSVFVLFDSLRAAQSAYQSLTHHQPLHMSDRFTGIDPGEIIWSNLNISWHSRVVRGFIATGLVVFLVIFWSIPVAFVGFVSNIFALAQGRPWLSWLLALPDAIRGIVSGVLPPILLAVFISLVPLFMRLIARFGGAATLAEVEYRTQNSYFAFQIVQVFLVNSLASGAISSLSQILQNPTAAPNFLAQKLPSASNFYISYFEFQGLSFASSTILNIVGLIVFFVLGKILDSTPRKQLTRWMNLSGPGLGSAYPVFTNIIVICLAYSIIAPLVLFFAACTLYLFYLAFRYEFLYVYGTQYDTKGLMYPRALQQLMVGLYLSQVCIIGLFAIGAGSAPQQAIGPLILMIVFLVFTILYHLALNAALDPLLKYLPKTLETEERRLQTLEGQDGTDAAGKEALGGDRAHAKKPNFFTKWLRPDIYSDYHTLRKLIAHDGVKIEYDEVTEREAFHQPAIVSQPPLLWIPRDEMGISSQEVKESSKVIDITDNFCTLDAKNNLEWNRDEAYQAPIYEEKTYY